MAAHIPSLAPLCWVMTEDLTGTRNQCLALAQAVGITNPLMKTLGLKAPWRWVTPYIRLFHPMALTAKSATLAEPWPDLIIASGRKAIAAALWVKRQSSGKAVLVIVQSPVIKDKHFDLVIAPRHDQYDAPNAMTITGALSVVTTKTLADAMTDFPQLAIVPQPRVAVLMGGTSRTHKFTAAVAEQLTQQLKQLQEQHYGLMVTASRRTPAALSQRIQQDLQRDGTVFWDGMGPNPYQAYLAYADVILVTEDSVSMACEAIGTGKPVYIVTLDGGSPRFARFHDDLVAKGYARWFDGQIAQWDYTPPNDLATAAARVKMLLQKTDNLITTNE